MLTFYFVSGESSSFTFHDLHKPTIHSVILTTHIHTHPLYLAHSSCVSNNWKYLKAIFKYCWNSANDVVSILEGK